MENFSEKPTWFMPLPPRRFFRAGAGAPYLDGCELFSCGRDALLRILKIEKFSAPRKIWLPEFFCPSVVRMLGRSFEVRLYADYPSEPAPRFETLKPDCGDAVLAVDFFGLRAEEPWRGWLAENADVMSVADVSHAPFSGWLADACDYSFASLRKTLPVPDGGLLRGRNFAPAKMFRAGSGLCAFAGDMLSAATIRDFSGYAAAEDLYYAGEDKLDGKAEISRISKYSLSVLENFDISAAAKRTLENLEIFCAETASCAGFVELNRAFGNLSNPFAAFSPALKFRENSARDKFHNALYAAGVMPSIYWGGLGAGASARAHLESDTTFVIPLDFRHCREDAASLARLVRAL